MHQPVGQFGHSGAGYQRDGAPRLALVTINVIFTKPKGDVRTCSGFMSMAMGLNSGDRDRTFKKAKVVATPILGFSEEDKEGTFEPHDNALVVTIRIGDYNVKKVLVD